VWLRFRLGEIADAVQASHPNRWAEAEAWRELIPQLLPWQEWFFVHALELLPGAGRVFRFRIILLLVSRQNGKTTIMKILILWRLFQDGAGRIIGAASKLEKAEDTWDEIVMIAELIPELADEIGDLSNTNGSKSVTLDSLEEYLPQATNSRAGRGWDSEMVLVDELREHKTWDAWGAISKTTMSKDRGQAFGVSNAGDTSAIVLRHLRAQALAQINGTALDGFDEDDLDIELRELLESSAIGHFEWSAREDRNTHDRDGWYEANPSLGWTIQEPAIAASLISDPEWMFRTEVLCQFVDSGAAGGPFEEGTWDATQVPTVTRDAEAPAAYCVDLSYDRKMAYIAVAFFDIEGRARVEIAAARAGTDWIIPWLQSPDRRIKADLVTLQTNGAPVSSLLADFEAAGIELVEWQYGDLGRASGMTFDELSAALERDGIPGTLTLTHGIQPVLDLAATTAQVKAAGDGWLIDRKNSPEDAAPLVAFVGALWLLRVHGLDKRPSVYESRGVRTF
jgi:hypothetical protein